MVGDAEEPHRELRVIGCGDRNWKDPRPVRFVFGTLLQQFGPMDVWEGECPYGGADKLIAEWAVQHRDQGVRLHPRPANFQHCGRAGGPIRNRAMLYEMLAVPNRTYLVVAFHDDLERSKGTRDMVEEAEKFVPVWVFTTRSRKPIRRGRGRIG